MRYNRGVVVIWQDITTPAFRPWCWRTGGGFFVKKYGKKCRQEKCPGRQRDCIGSASPQRPALPPTSAQAPSRRAWRRYRGGQILLHRCDRPPEIC